MYKTGYIIWKMFFIGASQEGFTLSMSLNPLNHWAHEWFHAIGVLGVWGRFCLNLQTLKKKHFICQSFKNIFIFWNESPHRHAHTQSSAYYQKNSGIFIAMVFMFNNLCPICIFKSTYMHYKNSKKPLHEDSITTWFPLKQSSTL